MLSRVRAWSAFFALVLWVSPAAAQVYDAAAAFSPTANPNGVWRYGYTTTLGGTFLTYTENGKYPNPDGSLTVLDHWGENIQFGDPAIMHNGTGGVVTLATVTYQPGQLAAHPGPNGEYSVLRFTAPAVGIYTLQAAFTGLDFQGPTTTDVHVLVNGLSFFDGSVSAFGTGPSYSNSFPLLAGGVIDLAVGYGSNGTFNFDTTGLSAVVAVPEPSGLFLLGSGLFAAVARRRLLSPAK